MVRCVNTFACLPVFLLILLQTTFAQNEIGATGGRLGVGYDEGLVARAYLTDKISAHLGFGYRAVGADTISRQPLQEISWKLGGSYVLWRWERLQFAALAEWRQELHQHNTKGTIINEDGVNAHMRYNQWNTIFRVAVHPEFFVMERFSIDYKFGLEFINHGPTYDVNLNRSGTQSNKDNYSEFGVYRARPLFGGEPSLLLNLGFTFYIADLPFLPLK